MGFQSILTFNPDSSTGTNFYCVAIGIDLEKVMKNKDISWYDDWLKQ